MSPNVGNFVHDLVEMAKAMETLPQVQAENERLQKALDNALQTVQNRELAAIEYNNKIDELHSRIRSLEVEREDASFRVLEVEDREHATLTQARDMQASLVTLITRLDPPKPEPVKEPEPQAQPVATPAEGDRTPLYSDNNPPPISETVHSISEVVGQSEMGPTTTTHVETTTDAHAGSTQQTASLMDQSASTAEGPYSGLRYIEYPYYVSRYDWEQGGGTEADYDWHPTPSIASGSY